MGLLLSILVFSVGVLEALACVRHIQQGILPAWAPRHVTTSSGRRLLREHWRKSTSLDDGSGDGSGPSGDADALPNGAPSRRHLGDRKGSLDEEEHLGRSRPPPLTLSESPHHVRSPDIHWPEPVPHSPVKNIEQTLPSPVAEVPGDAPSWPAEAPPPLLQRRRTSTTETLPHEEHGQAEPLRAAATAAPQPSFARKAKEPPRNKPAKASSFEEARVEPFAPPPPKTPEVVSLNHVDRHAQAGPRAAVVASIEVTASAQSSLEDAPAPWPIVNIDTVATSDEEGDVSPPSNLASRRVSFDPVPTVVVIDNEKPITEERERGTILAPSIRITDDLESVLRKELPRVIDDIIQQALVKVNDLESRQNGPLNGVSLLIENLVSKSDKVLNGPLASACAEEYKNHFEPTVQSVIELQKDAVVSAISQEDKLGRSKEEIGARHHDNTSPLENKGVTAAGVDKFPSVTPKEEHASTLESGLSSSEEPSSQIQAENAVHVDISKVDNLSTSAEPVSQTNVPNSIQDVKNWLGNSEDLIPETVQRSSESKPTDETGVSNRKVQPTVFPSNKNSAPNSSKSPHDTSNENEVVENEIRNELREDERPEERTPETSWKLQSPTAGESLILGDTDVTTAATLPAEFGSISSTPASSAALPPTEKREKAGPAPLASAPESPVASAEPHIPSDAPEFLVASDSASIPIATAFTDQINPDASGSSWPNSASNTPDSNLSIALVSPAPLSTSDVQVASVAPSSPVVPSAPVAPSAPATPSAPSAPAAPSAPVAPSAPAAPSPPAAPSVPPVSIASAAPVPSAPPVTATISSSPPVPVPAPASSKAAPGARPAFARQPPAPAPAVGAPFKEEEPSRAPSSPGRSAGGGRLAAPAAPKAPVAPAPQPEAFWVSDASSSPAPNAQSSPPKAVFTAAKKSTPVSQSPPVAPKTPTAPWTQKSSSAGSTKQPFSGFQKSVSAESSKNPQTPTFTKVAALSKTPPSPTFVKKQFGAPAPTPVASFPLKPTSSPFGSKVASSAPPPFYKPATASTTPSFLANLTPKTSSSVHSRFPDSSPVPEPLPRAPSPTPAPAAEKREASSAQVPISPAPPSDAPPRPASASQPAPGSSRPTSPPPRDPQEVVRRLAELRRTNPTVATEVLLSILGFKFPGS